MVDASHLERMGRELNCPICLSLLNSAVSLTCNHVFCNSCIEKSMKSASHCPVCKVPYRRREIRHAPHMDNLVSVYRNMEVSSGVNIFVTQTAVSTKISGKDKQTGSIISRIQDKNELLLKTLDSEKQKLCKKRESKQPLMTNQGDFDSSTGKPSFPTKKRVQVPLCPTLETQRQPAMLEGGLGENNHQENSLTERDKPVVNEKGELVFSPFFWLREEEDVEKSSQHTFEDQVTSTPPDAPSFSDIKDSDDEVPRNISSKSVTCNLSNERDFLDSEMFDWTQRPCSPELCSSPLEMQIADTTDHIEPQEKAEAALMDGTASFKIRGKKRKSVSNTRGGGKAIHNKGQMSMALERVSNATETKQSKRNKKSMHEEAATYIESQKLTDQAMLEKSGSINKPLNTRGIPGNNKLICSDALVQEKASEEVLALSTEKEPPIKSNKTAFEDFSVSKYHPKSSKLKKNGKSSKISEKPVGQRQKFVGKVKAQKIKTDKDIIKNSQGDKVLISNVHANISPLGYEIEVADQGKTSKTYEGNSNKKLKSLKKVKFSKCVSKKNCSIIPLSDHEEETVRGQNVEETRDNTYQLGMEASPEMDKAIGTLNWTPLQKCKTLSNKVQCSFCQSSEESEASGTLVKYLNGKLISDSQNIRSKVVHVHKNCAEWAPNVYFEGNSIVNLEAELSRSQRIRCACCGIKGAALGCYQKTCRKSFHFPCARLTPECRWDYENFVMLCPLHVSFQLPNEEPESQTKQKRKVSTKSQSNIHQLDIIDKCESGTILHWKPEKKFKNLVICCSALNNVEKGILSEFVKKSGVTILKNWDLSVTHVIASTDENCACRRTLKFLMAVLEGKWILSIEWIKACMKAQKLVEEQVYEIAVDIHGIRDGPRLGRLRLLDKQPKLFDGCMFYFMGDFLSSYKGYLHDLAIAAGGKVLSRKPIAGDQAIVTPRSFAKTFIIYSLELPENCRSDEGNAILNRRRGDAEDLASSTGAIAASNSWILNSIAGHKLQNLG